MPTRSIVQEYILKAIQCARFEQLDDGSVTAWIPDFAGLIALGANGRACLDDLWRRLDEWIQTSIEEGLALPIIDGIDLNSEDSRKLARYREPRGAREQGRLFESDEEFLESLAE